VQSEPFETIDITAKKQLMNRNEAVRALYAESVAIDASNFDFDAEYAKLNLLVLRRKSGAAKTDPNSFVFESEQPPAPEAILGGARGGKSVPLARHQHGEQYENELGGVERVNISDARLPRSAGQMPCPMCGGIDGSVTEATLGIWALGSFRNDLVYGNESGFEAFALLERFIKERM